MHTCKHLIIRTSAVYIQHLIEKSLRKLIHVHFPVMCSQFIELRIKQVIEVTPFSNPDFLKVDLLYRLWPVEIEYIR